MYDVFQYTYTQLSFNLKQILVLFTIRVYTI